VEIIEEEEKQSKLLLLKNNLKSILSVIKEPTVAKLFLYLVLQGVCVPSFASFDYYFATEILKISPTVLSFMTFSIVIIVFIP